LPYVRAELLDDVFGFLPLLLRHLAIRRIVGGMDKKVTAAIVAVAVALEAILPHRDALPHTEVTQPPDSGKDIPSTDGSRRAKSATAKIIAGNDLVTLPTTGKHFSLAEIRASEVSRPNGDT
jgi:hypothetical protein